MTDPALLDAFEQRFRADPDPWNFAASPYEHAKRAATLRACGPLASCSVLELGAANGVLAALLGRTARRVVAVEAVRAAATLARDRLEAYPGASVVEGLIPDAVPREPFDVIVASEVLYYLDDAAYASTLRELDAWLAPGGRLVAVHWRPTSAERPRSAEAVHADLTRLPFLTPIASADTDDYLLSVWGRS